MQEELPKFYNRNNRSMDSSTSEYRKELWNRFANAKVKIVPSETGFNSFPELEKYSGTIGTVNNIEFTVNGRAVHIYITNCPLPLDEKFLELV